MTTPVGLATYLPPSVSPGNRRVIDSALAADLTRVLNDDEAKALASTFGRPHEALPEPQGARASTLGRHLDVRA